MAVDAAASATARACRSADRRLEALVRRQSEPGGPPPSAPSARGPHEGDLRRGFDAARTRAARSERRLEKEPAQRVGAAQSRPANRASEQPFGRSRHVEAATSRLRDTTDLRSARARRGRQRTSGGVGQRMDARRGARRPERIPIGLQTAETCRRPSRSSAAPLNNGTCQSRGPACAGVRVRRPRVAQIRSVRADPDRAVEDTDRRGTATPSRTALLGVEPTLEAMPGGSRGRSASARAETTHALFSASEVRDLVGDPVKA